jgi:hypothetical protein
MKPYLNSVLIIIVFSVLTVLGCSKSKSTEYPNLDIATQDKLVAYSSINFKVGVPDNNDFSWDFGDGSPIINSKSSEYRHSYVATGSYLVSVTINNDVAHKVQKTFVINDNYSFNSVGAKVVDSNIQFYFKYTVKPAKNYLWDFGDGKTSTDAAPTHSYAHSGNYIVKVTIDGDSTQIFPGYLTIYTDPLFTSMIIGMKHWKFAFNRYSFYVGTPDSSNSFDTSFGVAYIDPVTIAIGHDTFGYSPTTSAGNVLAFESKNYFSSVSYDLVKFDHVRDTINFSYNISTYINYTGPGHPPPINNLFTYRTL